MPIDTPHELREHIELAIKVELSTVPPYLYAMYSIEDQGSEPALLIRSIVAEEMLHAVLATNLLLAVGGKPDFESTAYIPTYPSNLPHHKPPLRLELAACSVEMVRDVFMRIEQPEVHGAPAQPDEFETLGQFYHALEIGLERLADSSDLFADPQIDAQLSDPSFYAPVQFDADDSGGLMMIDDVQSAIEAIEIIIHQGEGLSDEKWADPAHQELTHYYKLLQIIDGTSPLGSVRSLRRNPTTRSCPPEIQPISDLFNASYRYLFLVMNDLFTPGQEKTSSVERLYRLMTGVLSDLAKHLVTKDLDDGSVAGPTFEIFEFSTSDASAELSEMASRIDASHPELASVTSAIRAVST